MDIEEIRAVLQPYKPQAIAKSTGLCTATVYNFVSGREQNSNSDTIDKFYRFLVSQQVAIATLKIQQAQ